MSHGHSHGTANDDIETASANELTPLVTGQRKRSDNIQAAILHVIGDLIVSGAVLVAGIVIKYKVRTLQLKKKKKKKSD